MEKKVKSILFVINHMDMGGIQKALIELLWKVSKEYKITLMVIKPNGVLMENLPSNIELITPCMALQASELAIKECCSTKIKILRSICAAWSRAFSRKLPAYLTAKLLQPNLGTFDAAISYTQPLASKLFCNLSNEVVLYSCSAARKITFVHCDFLKYGGNDACNRNLYGKFDRIAVVSDSVGEKLAFAVRPLRERIVTVYNLQSPEVIMQKAAEDTVKYPEKVSVVTVARLSDEKGLERCVPIFAHLRQQGIDIGWHIIGDGSSKEAICKAIEDNHMQDYVVLHGMHQNPYRFMKNADLLFLPSFHEAAPVVYSEAEILRIPILTTQTTSAVELVKNRHAGWVCGLDVDEIEQALKDAISKIATGKGPSFDAADLNECAANAFRRVIEE